MGEVTGLQQQADHEIAWQRKHITTLEYLLLALTTMSIGFAIALTHHEPYSWHFILWIVSIVLMGVSLAYGVVYIYRMMESNKYLLSSFFAQVSYFGRKESLAEEMRSTQKLISLNQDFNKDSSLEEKVIQRFEKQLSELHTQNTKDVVNFSQKIKESSDTARKALMQQVGLLGFGYMLLIVWHVSSVLSNDLLKDTPKDAQPEKSYSTPSVDKASKTSDGKSSSKLASTTPITKSVARPITKPITKLEPVKVSDASVAVAKEQRSVHQGDTQKEAEAKALEPKIMIWWSKDEHKRR